MAAVKAIVAGVLLAATGIASGQNLAGEVVVGSGLSNPLFVTAPSGDTSRIFVVEQRYRTGTGQPWYGRIRTVSIPSNTLQASASAFFDMRSVTRAVASADEQGLLGLAFHPNFMSNGYFWVNYTRASDGATVVARYRTLSGNGTGAADMNSEQIVYILPQPANNHNGGWMAFGPDGMLHITQGDGGGANDNQAPYGGSTGNAQRLETLLGKMLRIDVDGPDNIPGNSDDGTPGDSARTFYRVPADNPFVGVAGAQPEILHYGLRNPWRPSFDRETGDLYIADVGQGVREEVNLVSSSARGLNFGWRCFEGTRTTGLGGCNPLPENTTAPLFEYGHATVVGPTSLLGCSITGGYVYRGSAIPWLRGSYFYSDYCVQSIYSWRACGTQIFDIRNWTAEVDPDGLGAGNEIQNVTSFGEDAAGELYICDRTGGQIFKIVPGPTPLEYTDCNANNVPDDCDIAGGASADTNNDGIPDECAPPCPTCAADYDGNGGVDGGDLAMFFADFEAGAGCADVDQNGGVDGGDLATFFTLFEAGGC